MDRQAVHDDRAQLLPACPSARPQAVKAGAGAASSGQASVGGPDGGERCRQATTELDAGEGRGGPEARRVERFVASGVRTARGNPAATAVLVEEGAQESRFPA